MGRRRAGRASETQRRKRGRAKDGWKNVVVNRVVGMVLTLAPVLKKAATQQGQPGSGA